MHLRSYFYNNHIRKNLEKMCLITKEGFIVHRSTDYVRNNGVLDRQERKRNVRRIVSPNLAEYHQLQSNKKGAEVVEWKKGPKAKIKSNSTALLPKYNPYYIDKSVRINRKDHMKFMDDIKKQYTSFNNPRR